jgi:hypothetical protein
MKEYNLPDISNDPFKISKPQKEVTLKLVGYEVRGEATMNMWGGGKGTVEMKPQQIMQTNRPSKKQITGKLNDGGFGCESIDSATVDLYAIYESGHMEYLDSFVFDKEDCKNAFRGI